MIRFKGAPVLALVAMMFATLGIASAQTPATPQAPPDPASVRASLAGTWQNVDDPRLTREFDADGQTTERYEGDRNGTVSGDWSVFLGKAPPPGYMGHGLVANTVYLKVDQNGDELLFALVGLGQADLRMVYLAQGNLVSFMRLK
jgi:hypothetical protein